MVRHAPPELEGFAKILRLSYLNAALMYLLPIAVSPITLEKLSHENNHLLLPHPSCSKDVSISTSEQKIMFGILTVKIKK